MRDGLLRTWLRAVQRADRLRLRALHALHPGLEVHPTAATALAVARYQLAPGARLVIGPRVAADRRAGALTFHVGAGAEVVVEADAWLRTEIGPVNVVAFDGARIRLGPESFLNGCHVSAKREVTVGRRSWIGPGSRVFDADQHDFDAERPERVAPVRIGGFVWIASDVTVLRGVAIGDHAVVGARSLVLEDVPAHALAFGAPARVHGRVGDRSRAR